MQTMVKSCGKQVKICKYSSNWVGVEEGGGGGVKKLKMEKKILPSPPREENKC